MFEITFRPWPLPDQTGVYAGKGAAPKGSNTLLQLMATNFL